MQRRIFMKSTFTALGTIAFTKPVMAGESVQSQYRVGILGTDNSHSGAFSDLLNVKKRIPGVEVVAMYGRNPERTKEMADKGQVKKIVSDPKEMLDLINVAIVCFRHGGLHAKHAIPFLERGIPTFVDKPMALKTRDATLMLAAAKEKETYISSFSTVRWGDEVKKFLEDIKNIGDLVGGAASGPGSAESEYGGFGFYGIHTIELLCHTIADRVVSVSAIREGTNIAGTLVTESGRLLSIQVAEGLRGFNAVAYGKKGQVKTSTGGSYEEGLKVFFKGLRQKQLPLSYEQLFEPVAIIEAMEISMRQNGRQVKVKSLEL